ncbi:hypothetical protein ACFU5O_02510 [Streptomyces sp. NPDC057445]|uniref:hypothetical protein n=1 Tax=Streptomyces sp. NPDC057445 TaxID=3346136 RepID=UPI00368F07A5
MPDDTPVSTEDPVGGVLADLAVLARQHGWAAVSAFIDALPGADDRTVLLLDSRTDGHAAALARELAAGEYSDPVATAPLETVVDDPGAALRPNRALLVLPCGELLTPEVVEAAAAVMQRPAGTTLIVLAGAEAFQSPDDLDMVQRGVWRMLLAGAVAEWGGQDWAGEDLGERGCLLWSAPAGRPLDFLGDRLTRDADLLRHWLRADAAGPVGLLREQRASYALTLAEQAAAAKGPQPGHSKDSGRRVAPLREELDAALRRRLKRLEENRDSLERQTGATLDMLEQDLLRAATDVLGTGPDRDTGQAAVRAKIDGKVDTALLQWLSDTAATLRDRTRQFDDETRAQLEDVDWTLVREIVTDGSGPYPQELLDGARFEVRLETLADELCPTGAPRSGSPGRRRSPVSRGTLVGGAIGLAAATLTGIPVVIPIAGVAGAVGGHAVDGYVAARESERLAAEYAKWLVPRRVATARAALREHLRRATDRTARATENRFGALDRALDKAFARPPAPAGALEPSGDPTAEQQLAGLRRRLEAAHAA